MFPAAGLPALSALANGCLQLPTAGATVAHALPVSHVPVALTRSALVESSNGNPGNDSTAPDTSARNNPAEADPRRVVEAWPTMLEPIKAAVLALVQCATGSSWGIKTLGVKLTDKGDTWTLALVVIGVLEHEDRPAARGVNTRT